MSSNTELLKTIVADEGVRVIVREVMRGDLTVEVIEQDILPSSFTFEVPVTLVEQMETPAMVESVTNEIKGYARWLRRLRVEQMLASGLGLGDEGPRAMIVDAIVRTQTPDVVELLAIELIQRVERLGK